MLSLLRLLLKLLDLQPDRAHAKLVVLCRSCLCCCMTFVLLGPTLVQFAMLSSYLGEEVVESFLNSTEAFVSDLG